jgi:hypothetical protein
MPENAYICDLMYHYADCHIFVRVYKKSDVSLLKSSLR